MTLLRSLEQLFRFRLFTKEEIPAYLKRMAELGRFDEPKKIALFAELSQRVAALEERVNTPIVTTSGSGTVTLTTTLSEPLTEQDLPWKNLVEQGKKLGVYTFGMKKDDLKAAIQTAQAK